MPISVAIVGSGPAGFYAAEALSQLGKDVQVDVIERLPTPFGLIRAGVAPDHETTKKVAKKFEKTALRDEVRFFGNVEVSRDLSIAELQGMYDAVVLAVGGGLDRPANLPGEDKAGVYGSAEFVSWYNGHPDYCDLNPDLNTAAAAVIGIGNVAIDVARLLMRSEEELKQYDLPDYAFQAIKNSPLTEITMFGRRGPVEAKFTNVELRELGRLTECVPQVRAEQLPEDVGDLPDREKRLKERNLESLREFSTRKADEQPKRLHIEFFASPVEILGGKKVEGLRLERTRIEDGRAVGTGETFDIECGLVVTAIGYRSAPMEGVPFDNDRCIVPNEDGRVSDGLYAAGWIKRGPSGVISTNRPDGVTVAEHIDADFNDGTKPGRDAFKKLLQDRGIRSVSYADWKKIEEAEAKAAVPPAPRKKFVTIAEMLALLDGADA